MAPQTRSQHGALNSGLLNTHRDRKPLPSFNPSRPIVRIAGITIARILREFPDTDREDLAKLRALASKIRADDQEERQRLKGALRLRMGIARAARGLPWNKELNTHLEDVKKGPDDPAHQSLETTLDDTSSQVAPDDPQDRGSAVSQGSQSRSTGAPNIPLPGGWSFTPRPGPTRHAIGLRGLRWSSGQSRGVRGGMRGGLGRGDWSWSSSRQP